MQISGIFHSLILKPRNTFSEGLVMANLKRLKEFFSCQKEPKTSVYINNRVKQGYRR